MGYLLDHHILIGNATVDALGAVQGRREDLERARDERVRNVGTSRRNGAPRDVRGRNEGSMSKHQAGALLCLGIEMLLVECRYHDQAPSKYIVRFRERNAGGDKVDDGKCHASVCAMFYLTSEKTMFWL